MSIQSENQNGQVNPDRKKGKKISSIVWALIFTLLIAGWMLSGILMNGTSQEEVSAIAQTTENEAQKQPKNENKISKKLFRVQTKIFQSQPRQANLLIRGRTEVDARVQVKAQTAGLVVKAAAKKGIWINKGELLCRIETAEREATLLQAKARLAQARADYDANKALARKGHTAQLRLTSYKAQLDTAKAELKRAELDYQRTNIKAPFDGFLEEQPAKVGDYLTIGMSCATLVALDPLIVVGNVSELEVSNLKLDMQAKVQMITGEERDGKIRFISSSADKETRTFRVEVEIQNKEAKLRDGVTSDINIPLALTNAHQFSPAILVLNDQGQIGVRTVDQNSIVRFLPVKLLSDDKHGVWVSGLPDQVRVITVGQEYVIHNQKVIVDGSISQNTESNTKGS